MKQTIFELAELFSGPGGLALGAVSARAQNQTEEFRVKSVWANDMHLDTCKTYARNLHRNSEGQVAHAPIQDIDIPKIKPFDALAFGFPCNDFSLVGEQKGFDGKYGPLYSYGVKALESHNPKWFIAENVSGLRSANGGSAMRKILSELSRAGSGYDVVPHLYKFEEYGVPQTRHRIVIVGIRSDLGLKFRVPAPTTAGNHISSSEALAGIPFDAPNHELQRQHPRVVARLKHIPAGGNAWSSEIPEELRLNVKGARLSNIYKRLDPNKPSYTVTGSGGGGTHMYHWAEPRALTNREKARLQTFPDDFIFEGSPSSVKRQIGMAVPPLAAKHIIEAILNTFAGIEYEYVPANLTYAQQESFVQI